MNKIKNWLSDKYYWLKTFNKKPEIDINGTIIVVVSEPENFVIKGRLALTINANLILVNSLNEITPELINKIKNSI